MSVYKNSCGHFAIEVSEPWPMWVRIKSGENELRHLKSDDLYDLKHLVERAIAAVEAKE